MARAAIRGYTWALALLMAGTSAMAQTVDRNLPAGKVPDPGMVAKVICVGLWDLNKEEKVAGLPSIQPGLSHGSGLVVQPDGIVLTNRHVVDGCVAVQIKMPGSRRVLPATVAYMDRSEDVAFVVADANNLPSFDLRMATDGTPGTNVVVEGYPLDIRQPDPAITTGVVSRWYERPGAPRLLQISAAISPGNSGGPVFDDSGGLLGISVAYRPAGQNYNLAVPSSIVLQSFRDMSLGNDVRRAREYLSSRDGGRRGDYAQSALEWRLERTDAAWSRMEQLVKQGSGEAMVLKAGELYRAGQAAADKGDKKKFGEYLTAAIELAESAATANSDLKSNEFLTFLLKLGQAVREPSVNPPAVPTPPAGNESQAPERTAAASLRLHGSNTIGAELAPALARGFLNFKRAADVKLLQGARPNEYRVVGQAAGQPLSIEIFAHGTATAFTDLGTGSADIGMASRPIKDDEARKLASLGDLRSFDSEHVIGLDGIAIVVNPSNRVAEFRIRDLARIFSGEISDWSQLDTGLRGPIRLHTRDAKSGTYDTFKSLVLHERSLSPGALRYESNDELSDAVAADENGIGFVALPAVRRARAIPVRDGASSMVPTIFTIRTEDYPLTRRLFFYATTTARNPLTRDFVEFTMSADGQRIVESLGFVGQIPDVMPDDKIRAVTPRYRTLTSGKQRLSINLKFRSGSFDLENKAVRGLNDLVKKLSEPENRSADVFLFGFADAQGNRETNCRLSESRAQAVADSLRRYGLRPSVAGFCDEMPVASNDSEEGREKNRRVEVWLRRR